MPPRRTRPVQQVMANSKPTIKIDSVIVRSYKKSDLDDVLRLFDEGRLSGTVMANDTAADIDNIPEAYLEDANSHFWVAQYEDQLVGMVGVARESQNRAEIRRLRVEPTYKGQGIAVKLMEEALTFCRHHGYLKVVLDTSLEQTAATEIFDRSAFQHNRTKTIGGKELLEFYLDLYREPKTDENAAS
jgi:GNAT superfamily N-acetyltransferase